MNRRIKRNRSLPIHITLPPQLLDDIDSMLSHKMSRSKWIRNACDLKLGKDVVEVSDPVSYTHLTLPTSDLV